MGHQLDLLKNLLLRLLFASPFLILQIHLARGDTFGPIFSLIPGFCAALIVAKPLIEILGEPLRALFYPAQRFSKPVPMYSVPQSKRVRGDFDEALADYEVMEVEYPGDLEIYRGMLELLVLDIKDPTKASAVFQRALLSLKKPQERDGLAALYQGIQSQAAGKPEWKRAHEERSLRTKPQDGASVKEPDGFSAKRFHSGGHYRDEQGS